MRDTGGRPRSHSSNFRQPRKPLPKRNRVCTTGGISARFFAPAWPHVDDLMLELCLPSGYTVPFEKRRQGGPQLAVAPALRGAQPTGYPQLRLTVCLHVEG